MSLSHTNARRSNVQDLLLTILSKRYHDVCIVILASIRYAVAFSVCVAWLSYDFFIWWTAGRAGCSNVKIRNVRLLRLWRSRRPIWLDSNRNRTH